MFSVTQRIKQIKSVKTCKQPFGGYINPKQFTITKINCSEKLHEFSEENIHCTLIGLAVDYLTRALTTNEPENAFRISILGATIVDEEEKARQKANQITNLSKQSIIDACQLSGYDVAYRAGPDFYNPVEKILPNDKTIKNIEIMVKRSMKFFEQYGPVVEDGVTFLGGYTETVSFGDGDFITKDTLWDFKVSKYRPNSDHTLQILMYYLMGKRSMNKNLHAITRLGIFNPRLNEVYLLNVSEIDPDTIKKVENDVIGYKLKNKTIEQQKYKLIASCFNWFFLEDKPAVLIRDLKEYLKDDTLSIFLSDKEKKRLVIYYECWVEFKNKWYRPSYDQFNCPLEWFYLFVQDCETHLQDLIKYASNCHKAWFKICIKNSKKVTWDSLENIKKKLKKGIVVYDNVTKEDLQQEEEFEVEDLF